MTQLYAQPYNIDATGFYFDNAEEYQRTVKTVRDAFGGRVEEFEIQFIDGERIDCELADTWELNQVNFASFLDAAGSWTIEEKTRFIIAVGECGYQFEPDTVDPNDFEIDLYAVNSMKDLAEQFIEDGLFGDIPKALEFYIDHEAIARDLAVDYTETNINNRQLVYRCM